MNKPAWAERLLGDKEKASAFDSAELDLHRQFFNTWVELHAVRKDKAHRNKAERLAQDLVDLSIRIKAIRGEYNSPLVVNGKKNG